MNASVWKIRVFPDNSEKRFTHKKEKLLLGITGFSGEEQKSSPSPAYESKKRGKKLLLSWIKQSYVRTVESPYDGNVTVRPVEAAAESAQMV